jgi:hypothetical protein
MRCPCITLRAILNMNFQPKTDKELAADRLLPAGNYRFEILRRATLGTRELETGDTVSKQGDDMILLVVKVFNGNGRGRVVLDYLVPNAFKLRQAAIACGLRAEYDAGSIDGQAFIGKTGMLKLTVEKDKTGRYADKNAVGGYLPPQ